MNLAMSGEEETFACPQVRGGSRRFWWALPLLLVSLAIGVSPMGARSAPKHAVGAQRTGVYNAASNHIYCIRGFLNVFSLGMDGLCGELSRMGMNASVYNHMSWGTVAEEAASEYKAGRVRNIFVIGHSLGAIAVANITERLGELGVPVRLAVELDSTLGTTASGQVDRFVNYYISTGAGRPAARGAQFRGTLVNIDVSKDPNIGHLNIDKNPGLHASIIDQIRQSLAHAPAPRSQPASNRSNSITAAQG